MRAVLPSRIIPSRASHASITLLAALTVTTGEHSANLDVFAVVWGTTVGLALAHWFAFVFAVRLVDPTSDVACEQSERRAENHANDRCGQTYIQG